MRLIILALYFILAMTESSRCPEPRKPHPTSCGIFYNCVNLPGGGYVWVPSKCTQGLIFEPYLRICVLPGDSWTCDTLSTEPPVTTSRYNNPELINPNETSYMGSTEDSPDFSELVDSSYTTDSVPDSFDRESATPYPLIEIQEAEGNVYDGNDNGSAMNNIQNDYLQTQDDNKKQYTMLNRLIHHLLIHKEITIPLEFLASSSMPTHLKGTQSAPPSNYLVQNYIQQNNNLQNTIITGGQLHSSPEAAKLEEHDTNEPALNAKDPPTFVTLFDHLEDENSVVLIADNAGNKQYMTVDKYKSLGYHLDPRFVRVLPCIKNVRMANGTDCLKYYVCEPDVASVIEYSCPLSTAFNKHARTCDGETYNKCMGEKNNRTNENLSGTDNMGQNSVANKNICTEHGKTRDPTSESRYYICYSASDKSHGIKSMRMTCPNGLIFCQSKKVCTTKRLCK